MSLRTYVERLARAQPADAVNRLQIGGDGRVGDILRELVADAERVAHGRRVECLSSGRRLCGLWDWLALTAHRELFEQLLESQVPQPVQSAVLQVLAGFESDEIPQLILNAWPAFSPQIRATATETLFARRGWTTAVLDAVEQGTLSPSELDPARIKLLQSSGDESQRERAASLFADLQLSRRQNVVEDYRGVLDLAGDRARGKAVFKKTCSVCHKLEGVGESVGADLKAIRDRGTEAVLLNILDPNREVKPQYLSYVLERQDGRVITGMITTETANSVTLRRPDGTSEAVLRLEIETLRSTGLSYMPEGLEMQADHQAMADLLAYLNSIR